MTTTKTKNKTNSSTQKVSPYKAELMLAVKKVSDYKLACEANITAILWKKPELYYEYSELTLDDFSNNAWKVFWQIGYDLTIVENKQVLDEVTVNLYLDKHRKLKKEYDDNGGYDTLMKSQKFVKIENLDGYLGELHKWNAVISMGHNGFPIAQNLSKYADMTLDEIYRENEGLLNHIFINAESEVQSFDASDGIHDLIERLDKGEAVGLEYYNLPLTTAETGGMLHGNITLVGALSNVGKSTFVRNAVIPSIMNNKEKIVVLINEEGKEKWQREFLIWIANNVYKKELQKYTVRDGGYSAELKALLHKCGDYLIKLKDENMITLIPLKSYSSKLAVQIIKKYASLGVIHFVLDTFKASKGVKFDQMWQAMQTEMVEIYDIVKPEGKNVHLTCTFQLSKSSTKQRYYTLDNVGMAKNIVDVASTGIMIRNLMDDEFAGGANALKVYRMGGKNGKTKVDVVLDPDKHYQLLFIVKNREGASNAYQIVLEHDMSKNILKEVGMTVVPQDF